MARYRITAPDGATYEVTAPDDATEEQVLAYAQANYAEAGGAAPNAPKAPVEEADDPTEGMGFGERVAAGFGRSFVEAGRGLKQAGLEAANRTVRNTAVALNRAGMEDAARNVVRTAGVDLGARLAEQQNEIDEARRIDAPLMATGGGQLGNAVGVATQVLGPAGLARNTGAASALLPSTIRGNAAQGAVMGALQPTATGESQGVNALAGGALGGAGAGAMKLAGSGVNALAARMRGAPSSTEQAAAGILMREADNPQALLARQQSNVPGVQRTLAEQTLDPGIARLERTLRSTERGFDARDRSNNAARVAAIEAFAGDKPALAAARASRDQQTAAALDQALQDRGVDIAPVRQLLEDGLKRTATRPTVQSALNDVKASLDQAGDDVFSLYGTRKYIDDLLTGKAGADKAYARAATRELLEVKRTLDKQLADTSPSFADYLDQYRKLSVPINRMQVGQVLIGPKMGSAIVDKETGVQVLLPAQFSRASRSLDEIAAKATGFKKARADQILQAGDIAVIKAIQDDLERQAFRVSAGSGGGSPTFERLAVTDRMGRQATKDVVGKLPGGQYIAGFMEHLDRLRNDRIKERLAYLVANPDEAERVIRALPGPGQAIVRKALTQIGGAMGRVGAVAATAPDQPLEIDIVGGKPVPADQFDR